MSKNRKLASLFEIRLKNMEHDVVILKGSEHNAASTFIQGKIVLSITEPISIKKLSLRLYGTLRLQYDGSVKVSNRPARFERKLYEYAWNSADFSKYLSNMYTNSSQGQGSLQQPGSSLGHATSPPLLSKTHSLKGSTTSLKSLGFSLRSMSSTSLSHLNSHGASQNLSSANLPSKQNHVLVLGNYEIPFHAILPGNMPESVEGLPGGNVVYKMEATIERGKFHNPMVTKKHVRVVRTMTTDSVELSETMAVDNTWPKKVEYSLSVPSKAIAIGSGTPVSFMLVPLLKGLQLGAISMSLVEMYSYVGFLPPPRADERVVCEKTIAAPREDDPNFQMDKWEVTSFLKIPPNLSNCTQDCDIQTHLKVRHKLKFTIGLKNPDGHTSELRASLPVQLFISPFVGVKARTEDDDDNDGATEPHEEEIFYNSANRSSQTNLDEAALGHSGENSSAMGSNSHSVSSFTGLVAPPMYEQRVLDKLWTDVSPMESPISSGVQTPRSLYSRSDRPTANGDMLQFSMSAIDTAKLSENLRQLSIQRQLQENLEGGSRSPAPGRATFNLDDDTEGADYFTRARPPLSLQHSHNNVHALNELSSPGHGSPVHLSRTGSEVNMSGAQLSRVPSYSEAMRSHVDETLSPAYKPPLPGSHIDLTEVNRRFEENNKPAVPSSLGNSRNRSFLSRGSSSFNLRGSLSHNSSNSSSPSNSRNVSSTNLSNMKRSTGSASFQMAL